MSKVRINDLARELEVKSRPILDALEAIGVSGKTHSSSIEDDQAEKVRAYFAGDRSQTTPRAGSSASAARAKFDLSNVSKPGDAMRAILERKKAEEAARNAPPQRPVSVSPPAQVAVSVAPPVAVVAPPARPAAPASPPAQQTPPAQQNTRPDQPVPARNQPPAPQASRRPRRKPGLLLLLSPSPQLAQHLRPLSPRRARLLCHRLRSIPRLLPRRPRPQPPRRRLQPVRRPPSHRPRLPRPARLPRLPRLPRLSLAASSLCRTRVHALSLPRSAPPSSTAGRLPAPLSSPVPPRRPLSRSLQEHALPAPSPRLRRSSVAPPTRPPWLSRHPNPPCLPRPYLLR